MNALNRFGRYSQDKLAYCPVIWSYLFLLFRLAARKLLLMVAHFYGLHIFWVSGCFELTLTFLSMFIRAKRVKFVMKCDLKDTN